MEQSGNSPLKLLSFANPVIYSYPHKIQLNNSTSGQKFSYICANSKFGQIFDLDLKLALFSIQLEKWFEF